MKTFKTALSLITLMATWLRVSLKSLTFIGVFISISSSALANQKVTLLLDWFVNPDHGPIIIAKEKGFFFDRGLVTINLLDNGLNILLCGLCRKTKNFLHFLSMSLCFVFKLFAETSMLKNLCG